MSKVNDNLKEALKGLYRNKMTLMSVVFGLCGITESIIACLRQSRAYNLTMILNNTRVEGFGLGQLLETKQISKILCYYVCENKEFVKANPFLCKIIANEKDQRGMLPEIL